MFVQLSNDQLQLTVVPLMGGKISSIFNKSLNVEFLWINKHIPFAPLPAGSEYDPNFIGGIDELIPNDIPEHIDGISYPDHGELWTTPLAHKWEGDHLTMEGLLPLSGLYYRKTVRLDTHQPFIYLDYTIRNDSGKPRHFMWKLHAALQITAGDELLTPATRAQVVDPAYSRFGDRSDWFDWPYPDGSTNAAIVPGKENSMDFFYLAEADRGFMGMANKRNDTLFAYDYDRAVFPYQWYFASYGGFLDHYTAILEPCTNMPIMVADAIAKNQSAVLTPGASIDTRVRIFAGDKTKYSPL